MQYLDIYKETKTKFRQKVAHTALHTPHSAHYLVGLALVRPARPLLDLLDPGLDGGVQVEEARPQGARPVGVLQVQRGRHDAQGLAVHSAADTAVQCRAANHPSVSTIAEKAPTPPLLI